MKRARDCKIKIGNLAPGKLNRITDVPGLKAGHLTLKEEKPVILRTGVSVLDIENVYEEPVAAASFVFNGFGKSTGLIQVDELGQIETPLTLTNTLSTGAVHQGITSYMLARHKEIRSLNPVILECNDGFLSDIRALAVKPSHVEKAFNNLKKDFELGSVGAGTGMIAFGFKGGIGSSSRRISINDKEYIIGSMVLANLGKAEDLKIEGLSREFKSSVMPSKGSLIMVLATNLPLLPLSLKRMARHTSLSIGRLGASGYNGSGDVVVAFSTGLRFPRKKPMVQNTFLTPDCNEMNLIFKAACDSTVEAIVDSMVCSESVTGIKGDVEKIPLID